MNSEFNGCNKAYEEAEIIVFGAPFDGTVSFRPGTRFASSQMRIESIGLETYSPYQDKDLVKDAWVYDNGDLQFPFGNKEKTLDVIETYAAKVVGSDKKPFMIGGEHLVTLPAVKAVYRKYPDLCVIHLDAHTDLRDYFFDEELSHATVIKKVWNYLGDGRIFQFGIRSGAKEEFEWAQEGHVYMEKFSIESLNGIIKQLRDKPVYITIDLDVLDPSIFPGTGTPEPGGITFKELLDAVLSMRGLNIVGADIVELSPHYDQSGVSTAAACKVMRELLLAMSVRS
jgi:agmatinase